MVLEEPEKRQTKALSKTILMGTNFALLGNMLVQDQIKGNFVSFHIVGCGAQSVEKLVDVVHPLRVPRLPRQGDVLET